MDQTHAIRIWFGNNPHIIGRDCLPKAFQGPCTLVHLCLAFHLQRYSYNGYASAPELQGLEIGDEHHK